VSSFDLPINEPLLAKESRTIEVPFILSDTYVGITNFATTLQSTNRLYVLEKEPRLSLSITVKETPKDSDSDGIYDNEDNCPLVANPDQADNNAIASVPVTFTKTD
jgi:hypothetical protein